MGTMEFQRWALEADLAKEIPVSTRIILLETGMTKNKLKDLESSGFALPRELLAGKAPFALEVGGTIAAYGKMIKKRGKHFFKIIETVEGT